MLVFWLIVLLLIGVVLAQLLPALMRPSRVIKTNAQAEKRAIFRQQFDEIEQDQRNGILNQPQYLTAKSELERRLLDEIGMEQTSAEVSDKSLPDRRLALGLLLLLPIAALFIYFKIGSPASVTIPVSSPNTMPSAATQPAADNNKMAGELEPLLKALKVKLDKDPGDGSGWALLARSYVEIKHYAEAVPYYEKAVKAIPNNPQLLADYAEALALANGQQLTGQPEALITQALKLDPHHVKALWLGATAAFNRKDYPQAITYWERLQQDLPANSEILPDVQSGLNEAYAISGIKPSVAAAKPAPAAQDAASTAGLSGTVTVAPALASKLDANATVFVFARAAQGMPIPLAIVRTTAKDLPYSYHLDDSSALMPTSKLSQAKEVVIVARISKSGDAKPQAGDLQGVSAAVKPVGDNVNIEINQIVP